MARPFLAIALVAFAWLAGCTESPQGIEPPGSTETTSATSARHAPSETSQSATIALDARRGDPEIPSQAERAQLPPCEGREFRTPPVDLALLTSITPIGNLAPPGHTLPTEHPFLHLWPGGTTDRTVPIASPADVTVTLIAVNRGFTQDPVDYTIWFAFCRDIVAYYNHVKGLSDDLQAVVDEGACEFQGESKETRCNVVALHAVADAVPMGMVGARQGNFDFGLADLRSNHTFANPQRYSTRSLHIRCAFDYYPADLRASFYDLLTRKGDNACGTSWQDVPGTLQGNWFHESTRDAPSEWSNHLAWVMDNQDPAEAVVSIAGKVRDPGTIRFDPTTTGSTNRRFADVTPDSGTQCYQEPGASNKVIVAMTGTARLTIESQTGTCAAGESFQQPYTYLR